jgi:hypothetical protein
MVYKDYMEVNITHLMLKASHVQPSVPNELVEELRRISSMDTR